MIVVRSFVEQSLLKRDLVPFAIYDLCIRVFANQLQCKKLLRMMNVREHLLSALDFFLLHFYHFYSWNAFFLILFSYKIYYQMFKQFFFECWFYVTIGFGNFGTNLLWKCLWAFYFLHFNEIIAKAIVCTENHSISFHFRSVTFLVCEIS